MDNSDEILFLQQVNKRYRGAYHKLYDMFYRSLVSFASHYSSNEEDIVQEVFLNIWENHIEFNSFNGLRVYLYRTVRNSCLNDLRHKKIEAKYMTETILNFPDYTVDPTIMEEEVFREIFSVIDKLPEKCKKVLLLHMDGHKNAEIAQFMKISEFTVKAQKTKALNFLRRHLSPMSYLVITLM